MILVRRTTVISRRGLTMVEAVISMLVVGVMLVAALKTVGAARLTERKTGERGRGVLLAEGLMSEILEQSYADPESGVGSFGLGVDELGDGSRLLWEDVDDYDGWSATPPEEKDGTPLSGFDGWSRSVEVRWVDPADFSQVRIAETGVKRITVTVANNDTVVLSVVALRTSALSFDPGS